MELLGYAAAAAILGVFLLFHHDLFFEENENLRGLSVDLTTVAIFLVAHAAVTALTSPTVALIGAVAVFVVMLRPVRFLRQRMEAAGFDTTRRDLNAPLTDENPLAAPAVVEEAPVDIENIAPVEVREPVTPDGGGLSASENAVWEDLTRRLD